MSAPITIIGSYVSPYVRKVLACANLKGIDYVVDPITAFFGNDEFEQLSPLRRIPVMIDGDLTLSDSSVIAAYFDEAYPGHALLPSDPKDRARARWFEEYADSRLGDVMIWSLFYQKFVRPIVWGEPADDARVAKAVNEDIPSECNYLEAHVPDSGFLFGDIGLADIALATFFINAAYVEWTPDPSRWPRLSTYLARVTAHPAIAQLLVFEDVQRAADIKGRRQALIDAGAKLSEQTWGTRERKRGKFRL